MELNKIYMQDAPAEGDAPAAPAEEGNDTGADAPATDAPAEGGENQ